MTSPAWPWTEPLGERTVASLLHDQAGADPNRVFCLHDDRRLSIGQLDAAVRRTASALLELGLAPGDRVATVLGNGLDQVFVMLACLSTGIVWVPINLHQRGRSLVHILENAGPSLVILDPTLGTPASDAEALPRHLRVIAAQPHRSVRGPSLAELVADASEAPSGLEPQPDDLVCISYTSGTTGKPKGVMLTDRMFRACATGVQHTTGATQGDVAYVWEPLHHNGGNQMVVFGLMSSVTLAIATSFSASRFWQDVARTGATHVHYLGGVLQILLKQERTQAEADHSVRVLWGGGCPRELWGAVERRLGLTPREVYGMTETASVTTANIDGTPGSVGRPLPHFAVAVGAKDGRVTRDAGVVGEILVQGREPGLLTRGYFGDDAATARLLPGGPWLRTGDRGSLDEEGNLFFSGRLNDSVRRRGENVSAWEVESVIGDHPHVAECAMIGVRAEIGEQDIKVFVRPVDGETVDPVNLVEWCMRHMAKYQIPRYIAIVDHFEKTPTERIKKEVLADLDVDTWDRERPSARASGA